MIHPRKVQFNSGHPHFDVVDSTREYIEHEIDSTNTTMYDTAARAVRVFYEDDETGIITRDVAKFEAWMARIDPPLPGTPTARKAFENGSTVTCADLGHEGSYIYHIPCTDPDAHRPFQRPVC